MFHQHGVLITYRLPQHVHRPPLRRSVIPYLYTDLPHNVSDTDTHHGLNSWLYNKGLVSTEILILTNLSHDQIIDITAAKSTGHAQTTVRVVPSLSRTPSTMGIVLYQTKLSPPVRAVLLTIKALGLDVELKDVDFMKNGHLAPEFIKMNPQHTVPTLEDDGFYIWDSHAITGYLVNKYGKDDSLYPKEPRQRAIVDQRLHFDSGVLFPRVKGVAFPILRQGAKEISENAKLDVIEAYNLLEAIMGDNQWVAGNKMTIADFCCVASVSTLEVLVPGVEKCPKVSAWLQRCKTSMVGYSEANQQGVDIINALVKKCLSA